MVVLSAGIGQWRFARAPLPPFRSIASRPKDQEVHRVRPPPIGVAGGGHAVRKLVAVQAQQPELETLAQQLAISDIALLMGAGA
jgi:hypothetical protein